MTDEPAPPEKPADPPSAAAKPDEPAATPAPAAAKPDEPAATTAAAKPDETAATPAAKSDEPAATTAAKPVEPAAASVPEAAPRAAASPAAGPDADELRAVEALFEAGDFREVNRRGAALAERTQDDAVRARARELTARVQLDPFVLWAWATTVVVVAGIVYYYVIR